MRLLSADVVLTRSGTWLGRVIRFAERRPGDPVRYNHVGVVTLPGYVGQHAEGFGDVDRTESEMTEALWHVRTGPVWDFYGPPAGPKRSEIAVYRPITLDESERAWVAWAAKKLTGRRYGWWKLLTHLGDSAISAVTPGVDVRLFRRLNFVDSRPICSYLVAKAFEFVGKDFGVKAGSASPDDIEDFCRSRPDKYSLVFEGLLS